MVIDVEITIEAVQWISLAKHWGDEQWETRGQLLLHRDGQWEKGNVEVEPWKVRRGKL
jgi:hypothetical protein